MADEDALIGIGADLTQLRRDLARLPNLSAEAAQKTLIEVERVTLRAEKAAKQANRRLRADNKKTVDSIKHIGETAGDADTALGGIASTLGLISPEAESATRAVQDLFAGVEGVARSKSVLGSVGVSVASLGTAAAIATQLIIAGGLAWKHYSDKAEDAKAKSEALRERLDALKKATTELDDAVDDMELSTLIAVGRFDQESISAAKSVEAIQDRADAMVDAAQADVSAAEAAIEAANGVEERAEAERELNRAQKDLAEVQERANEQVDRAINLALHEAEVSLKNKEAKEAEEAAREANAAALKREAEQAAELARVQAAESQAATIVQQATQARLTGLDAIEAEHTRTMESLLATEVATQEQIDALNSEFHERRLAYIDEEAMAAEAAAEARAKAAETAAKAQEDANAAALEQAKATALANSQATAQGISNVMGAASDGFKLLAEQMAASGKDGSDELFAAYKATAIAQAVIDGALAISGIWAQFGAYPPVAAALTAGAAAVSAVQIATIAAEEPSYHGGVSRVQASMNRAPDETSAVLRQDEAVLNSTAANRIGRSAIAALNAGGSMNGGGGVAAVEFRNKTSAAMLSDQQRRQGTPIKQHRRRGRGYGY